MSKMSSGPKFVTEMAGLNAWKPTLQNVTKLIANHQELQKYQYIIGSMSSTMLVMPPQVWSPLTLLIYPRKYTFDIRFLKHFQNAILPQSKPAIRRFFAPIAAG